MKRLSALFIGMIMIVGAQTAFGLEGSTYEDPSMNSAISVSQAWGSDKAEATNCSSVMSGFDNEGGTDGFKIEQVCLRDEVDADNSNVYEYGSPRI